MKKVFFIFFSFLAIAISANAHLISGNTQIMLSQKEDDRDISDDSCLFSPETAPKTRGIISLPVYAFLCDGIVTVYFERDFSLVTISIINEVTGEIVCSEQHNNPASFSADLTGQVSGEYAIEIVSDEMSFEGTFNL